SDIVLDSSASRFCGKSKNKTNKAYKMKKVVVLSAVAAAVMMAELFKLTVSAETQNEQANKKATITERIIILLLTGNSL
ncbi:hypothetical protein MJN54_35105, partial [Salmonella enterica subsp. enterica serovar Kentucky]|nr:hypothetical protein [Salmonella enterica subsp. enterica serovar Kentucky]